MASQDLPPSAAWTEAVDWMRKGQPAKAEEAVVRAAKEAREQFGPDSPEHATTQNDLGRVYFSTGQRQLAVEAFREAAAREFPDNEQATRDRLTYLMNHAMALEAVGELEGAAKAYQEGLKGREAFYGRDHAGYAFGLEPYAKLLLRKGDFADAVSVAEQALINFWKNRHERVATALAVRAEALMFDARKGADLFGPAERLPDELVRRMADAVFQRAEESDPGILSLVLEELLPMLTKRFGESDDQVLGALSRIANLECRLGDHKARIHAARRLVAACEAGNRAKMVVQALMGLALAQSDAGDFDGTDASYRAAAERAQALNDAALLSQVRRNHGLFQSNRGQKTEAEATMRAAIADAERSGNAEMLARGRVALGIFVQHNGRLDEARPLLADAVAALEPAHPDAVTARSHLMAVQGGSACGCGDTRLALTQAYRQFVLSQLPPGMVEDFKVELEDNDFKIGVYLARQPTDEEMAQLERINRHALQQFRQRLMRRD
jgi:tetratricopeptide (TPR) repeat protein